MFEKHKPRYLSSGVDHTIPLDVQILLWKAIDHLPESERDYLQVFRLSEADGLQVILIYVKLYIS